MVLHLLLKSTSITLYYCVVMHASVSLDDPKRLTFLQELADFDFGEVVLDCIHLSKRKEYGPNGFYKCIEEFDVKLDSN